MDGIEEQYINHPYPEPIENMDERISNNYAQISGMDLLWKKIFPEKEYDEKIDVLIARIDVPDFLPRLFSLFSKTNDCDQNFNYHVVEKGILRKKNIKTCPRKNVSLGNPRQRH